VTVPLVVFRLHETCRKNTSGIVNGCLLDQQFMGRGAFMERGDSRVAKLLQTPFFKALF
jgi:hypothetical protein